MSLRHWGVAILFVAAGHALGADSSSGLPQRSGAAQGIVDEVKGTRYSDISVPVDMGACHMCEWQPHPTVMPAPDQCGVGGDGAANQGIFSCGLEKNCDKRCDFVKCQGS